jgi:hypothetical protein
VDEPKHSPQPWRSTNLGGTVFDAKDRISAHASRNLTLSKIV